MPDPIHTSYSTLMCEWPEEEHLSSENNQLKSIGKFPDAASSEQAQHDSGDETPGTVWLCRRVAHLPLAEALQVEHWWLKTTNREAGMGACGEGIPGDRSDSPYFTETCVNDHTGEHLHDDVRCETVEEVDPSCVDRELSIGRALGVWTPLNQCQFFAQDVLDSCTPAETGSDGAEGASSE